jgi:nucleoid-associated protein YgaU
VIRGLVYLTGLATLGVLALVVAVAMRVDRWPWRNYAETGRQYVVERLEDAAFDEAADERGRPTPSPEPVNSAAPVPPPAAPAAAAPAPAPPPTPLVLRHTVARGETLYRIAGRYYGVGEKWMLIARANDIRRPADLRVGRVLLIPLAGPTPVDGTAPRRGAEGLSPKLGLSPAIEAGNDWEAQR